MEIVSDPGTSVSKREARPPLVPAAATQTPSRRVSMEPRQVAARSVDGRAIIGAPGRGWAVSAQALASDRKAL